MRSLCGRRGAGSDGAARLTAVGTSPAGPGRATLKSATTPRPTTAPASHAMPTTEPTRLGRRAFLKGGSLVLAAAGLDLLPTPSLGAAEAPSTDAVRFGLVTDLHY